MKALIITGGESPPPEFIRLLAESAPLIIAADSGFDTAQKAGVSPDLVVGDFDSIEDKRELARLPRGIVQEYPEDKDDTDTEIALDSAFSRGADHIVIAGGGGGRLDHVLAMYQLFRRGRKSPREWHTGKESVYYIRQDESIRLGIEVGALVSVFPAENGRCFGMNSLGLKWPLAGLDWDKGHFGVSNRALADSVSIAAGSNPLLVVAPMGSECFFQDFKAF